MNLENYSNTVQFFYKISDMYSTFFQKKNLLFMIFYTKRLNTYA